MVTEEAGLNLAEKGTLVQSLWDAVNHGGGLLEHIPALVNRVIDTGAWKCRVHRGQTFQHERFIDFITSKPLAGCGWDPDKVLALIKGDPDLERRWREMVTPDNHRPKGESNNNIITSRQGTGRTYTLSRLKREAPALYQKVIDKKLSPNAAAIQAGFRVKTISIPLDAERAASILRKYFKNVEIGELR